MGQMLSSKLYRRDKHTLLFWCPGCQMLHPVYLSQPDYNPNTDVWSWNNNPERPTFSPSLNLQLGPEKRCHSWIKDGSIIYLGDCYHSLKDQTVPLPSIPEDEL